MEFLYDLSKYKRCCMKDGTVITSFKMRETDGRDEEQAANMAKAKGGSADVGAELIRLCITEVNGQPVKQPYLALDTWNSRARGFAATAWKAINIVDEEEANDFLANAAVSQPALAAVK